MRFVLHFAAEGVGKLAPWHFRKAAYDKARDMEGGEGSSSCGLCIESPCGWQVEYAVNDGAVHNLHTRRPFERLLRKLLARPNRPEVLLVMTFATDKCACCYSLR